MNIHLFDINPNILSEKPKGEIWLTGNALLTIEPEKLECDRIIIMEKDLSLLPLLELAKTKGISVIDHDSFNLPLVLTHPGAISYFTSDLAYALALVYVSEPFKLELYGLPSIEEAEDLACISYWLALIAASDISCLVEPEFVLLKSRQEMYGNISFKNDPIKESNGLVSYF